MEQKAIVPFSLQETMTLGETLAKSGYFSDARGAAQAVVKVMAGRELGFGPIASMTGIYIVSGRVTLSANIMAAAVKRHERYDYRVVKDDTEAGEIAFYQDGEEIGRSTFTMQDAKTAGLTAGKDSHSWKSYPRNMLFARTISNGVKWYCPDAFYGAPIYTPDELGAEIDGETGEIVEGEVTQSFDPNNYVFANYEELYNLAAEHLGFNHAQHAKNALKKATNGDKDELTHQVAWQLLKDYQAAKEADDES
jgi:hypothetical protein